MKKIHLDSGLQLEVDETKLTNNMELLDDLAAVTDGDVGAVSHILSMILDAEQKKKLYEHLRKDGIVPADAVVRSIGEIFEKLGDKGKNS